MANDDYQYQPRPLPVFATIGIESLSAAQVAPTHVGGPNVDTPFLDSPFSNPDFTGGGGGGGGDLPTCADSRTIGTIRTSTIGLPCSGTVAATVTDEGVSITVGSKTLIIQLNGSSNQIFLDQGSKSIRLDPDDLTTDGPDASFHELDVPHMGALGKRVFFSSQAYAA